MIYIKEGTEERISNWQDNSIYVLADFDRTLTVGESKTSWSILAGSDLVPKEYVTERQEFYDYYRPFEIDETLDYETKSALMKEWWIKHINLFVKYAISEEVVNKAARDLRVMSFRKGAEEFLKSMHDRNIPVIIISAGIGNFIEQFLIKNNCYYDNIFIVSNMLKFENGIAVGVKDNIVHSFNKNEVSLPLEVQSYLSDRNNIILLGDGVSDTLMASEDKRECALKIGFLEEKVEENMQSFIDSYDVVCTDNTGFDDISKKLKLMIK